MAKSTRHSGVSFTDHELSDEQPPVVIRRAMLGGDPRLVEDGNSSQEFSERQQQESEMQTANPQLPAPVAENPSEQGQGPDKGSSVSSTTGNGQTTGQESNDYAEWSYKDLQTECKARELNASGKAEDLIVRLQEHDEAQSQSEEDDFA